MSIFSIILINLLLSGDNAIIVAMACKNLPKKQQLISTVIGSLGAIILRVILTISTAYILQIPFLEFIGGILLIYIAINLVVEEKKEKEITVSDSLMKAIKTILIADLIMSLDNVLAIAAIAQDNILLLGIGLGLSIPFIIFGSQILLKLIEKFPQITYIGAGLIAYAAVEIILKDAIVGSFISLFINHYLLIGLIVGGVLMYGYLRNKSALN